VSAAPTGPPGTAARWPRLARGAVRLPRLVLVPSLQRRSRVPFALVVLFVISAGLIGLLLLNTVLAQNAFVLFRLQQKAAALDGQEQQLSEAVARADAPTELASRAASLGMVPGGDPLFLRLPDGAVLGDPKAAGGSPAPQPTPRFSASPSVRRSPQPATPDASPTARPTVTSPSVTSPSVTSPSVTSPTVTSRRSPALRPVVRRTPAAPGSRP
jgi:hypothetical protein